MGIFSWHKKKNKLVLVFDIGSSSVGGALFLMGESGVPKIIKVVREHINLEESIDVDRFLSLAIKSLRTVVSKIYHEGMGKPDEFFCVLASPWHASQTRIIKLEKNTSFTFTSKLALDLIQKEISIFEGEYLAKYPDRKNGVRSIELKNIKIMLNGYEVSNPLDQKAKELEMTIFVSISPEQVLKKIEATVVDYFHFKEIRFSSFTLASFVVVRDMQTHSENFLLIDIGGEVTDIAMAKKNVLRESTSFPLGYNFIIRNVASVLKVSLEEAISLISLFQDGHATLAVAKKLGPIIDQLKGEWLIKFQESLANLSNDISIPSTIYVGVYKDFAEFFSQLIRSEQFNQYTLTESKFNITFLNAEAFQGMATLGNNVIRDPGLIIDSIYINHFLNKM